jgi:hypothetical protein
MAIKYILKTVTSRLITISILAALLIGSFFYIRHKMFEEKVKKLELLVSARLVECAELCVLKYEYEGKVEIQHSALWGLSTSEYEAKYWAVARAGVPDMHKIKFKITDNGTTIVIYLSPVVILGNDTVDEGRVITDIVGWFASRITPQEAFNEVKDSKAKRLEEIVSNGFLKKAEEQVKNVLNKQFTAMGFYKVIFQ